MTAHSTPKYNIYFEPDDISGALACMQEYGYCVLRHMIDQNLVEELKASVDELLDPDHDMPPASNRYHMTFAEHSEALWKLAETPAHMNYLHTVHGTTDLCWHRSAAILRTPGEPMGGWHTDHRAQVAVPQNANEMLNRHEMPGGGWYYLNGSHPERSGLAVIEKSHDANWQGPEGFEFLPDRTGFNRVGEDPRVSYSKMDVPGCVPLVADPGDLLCFAARTYHTNMATHERRYSCGLGFRPKTIRIDAPWPLPQAARDRIDALPDHLRQYAEGYTSYDESWTPG